jgi:hypothetical protein
MSHVEPGAVEPDDDATAAASGAAGHGTIRLRGLLPPRQAPAATATAPETGPVPAAGPVGHGAIRLRHRAEPERPPAAPEPVGHGTVVLYGTGSDGQARFAAPVVTDDGPTLSAREDIRAALVATA